MGNKASILFVVLCVILLSNIATGGYIRVGDKVFQIHAEVETTTPDFKDSRRLINAPANCKTGEVYITPGICKTVY